MKDNYERSSKSYLTRRTPAIIRLDGKSFHTFTRNLEKPFDESLRWCFCVSVYEMMNKFGIQGAKVAYTQSDEVSILLTDYDRLNTCAWFDGNIQKIASVSASIFTACFNKWFAFYFKYELNSEISLATFDARVFNIPKEEITNYFLWRQIDWHRNSVSMLAQNRYSHKSLQGLNVEQMKQKLEDDNIIWENLYPYWKHGSYIFNNSILKGCNIYSFDMHNFREYFNQFGYPIEEADPNLNTTPYTTSYQIPDESSNDVYVSKVPPVTNKNIFMS